MKKILLVDDVEETRELINFALVSKGYGVIEFFDGKKVFEAVLALKPDLIILDIGLPGMNGFSVASQLSESGETSKTPIIVSSGYTKYHYIFESKKLENVVDFIGKPYLPEELIEKVQKIIGRP